MPRNASGSNEMCIVLGSFVVAVIVVIVSVKHLPLNFKHLLSFDLIFHTTEKLQPTNQCNQTQCKSRVPEKRRKKNTLIFHPNRTICQKYTVDRFYVNLMAKLILVGKSCAKNLAASN